MISSYRGLTVVSRKNICHQEIAGSRGQAQEDVTSKPQEDVICKLREGEVWVFEKLLDSVSCHIHTGYPHRRNIIGKK